MGAEWTAVTLFSRDQMDRPDEVAAQLLGRPSQDQLQGHRRT
jgi:hypothetical protein